jgi:ribosomal-protein-alanine N-acetyltransferase
MNAPYEWADRLPTLTAPRVALRWMTEADIPALYSVFGDPEVTRYWSTRALRDPAGAEALLREIEARFRARTLFQWGVCLRSDDAVIGTCTLFCLDLAHRRGELGYSLGRAHWGHGLMSEALSALIAFAFDTLGLHRIEADADPRNGRSIRTLERLGFRREGHLRERYHLNGEIQDALIFGLLRREWPRSDPGHG